MARAAMWSRRARSRVLPVIACAAFAAAACGAPGTGTGRPPGGAGTADVAYAGSLASLNEKVIGPAYTKATGYAYRGRAAGSLALSQEIRSGEIAPNVFESVGAGPITALGGKYPGWYVRFASSPIVVAYNPRSRYAGEFKAIASGDRPLAGLFRLMARPGFHLGRTDPNLDPQGQAFIEMLMLATSAYHLPAGTVRAIIGGEPGSADSPTIFAETALTPRLQAGQLDAASAYLPQAVQFHLPYIALPASINLGEPARATQYAAASFTLANGSVARGGPITLNVTTVGTTDSSAANAFVAYLLSPAGRALHKQNGYTLLTPRAEGRTGAVPAVISHELGG